MVCLSCYCCCGLSALSNAIHGPEFLSAPGDVVSPWDLLQNRSLVCRTFGGDLFSSVCAHYLVLDECRCFGCAVSKNDLGQWSSVLSVVRILRRLPSPVSSPSLVVHSVGVDPYCGNFLVVLLPAYCGLSKSAKSPRTKPPWLIALAGWTVIIGGLAFWTQGWADAALDNWSQGAPALTLIQLAQRADVWGAFVAHLFTLAVLTGPILYLLAMNGFSRKRSRICRA